MWWENFLSFPGLHDFSIKSIFSAKMVPQTFSACLLMLFWLLHASCCKGSDSVSLMFKKPNTSFNSRQTTKSSFHACERGNERGTNQLNLTSWVLLCEWFVLLSVVIWCTALGDLHICEFSIQGNFWSCIDQPPESWRSSIQAASAESQWTVSSVNFSCLSFLRRLLELAYFLFCEVWSHAELLGMAPNCKAYIFWSNNQAGWNLWWGEMKLVIILSVFIIICNKQILWNCRRKSQPQKDWRCSGWRCCFSMWGSIREETWSPTTKGPWPGSKLRPRRKCNNNFCGSWSKIGKNWNFNFPLNLTGRFSEIWPPLSWSKYNVWLGIAPFVGEIFFHW